MSNATAPSPQVLHDAVCTRCGCVCDDIDLTIATDGSRILEAQRACPLGREWFLSEPGRDRPVATIDGRPAPLDEAIRAAAETLSAARYPLVYGLTDTTCEAQGAAASLADWLGAIVDTTASTFHGPVGTAFHGVGEVTSTLGEIRNRGDLIVVWGANLADSHPRHFERYSLFPPGMFVPRGRADRTCVVVDVERNATVDAADLFLHIAPGRDFEALWTLRALVAGVPLDAAQIERETGVSLAAWQDLAHRMRRAKFGVLLFGAGLTLARGKHLNGDAVMALVRDLNAHTRFVARALREPGNSVGADNVLTWRTGFPFGVSFARGFPRFGPDEYTADTALARGEPDAALIVACHDLSHLSEPARRHLEAIPSVSIDAAPQPVLPGARVQFATARYGIESGAIMDEGAEGRDAPQPDTHARPPLDGTVYRMDEVPLPLRPAIASPYPSDLDVLVRLEAALRALSLGV